MNEIIAQYVNQANDSSNSGDYREAISQYSKALSLCTDTNSQILSHRAFAYMKIAMYDEALADINMAIASSPTLASLYSERAQITLASNDHQDAIKSIKILQSATNDYHQAAELDPAIKLYQDLEQQTKVLFTKHLLAAAKPSTMLEKRAFDTPSSVDSSESDLPVNRRKRERLEISSALSHTMFALRQLDSKINTLALTLPTASTTTHTLVARS